MLQPKNKAVFLDRDGVLNVERGEYTFRLEDFEICEGAPESVQKLKEAGFILIVISNQAGIARGFYTKAEVMACHEKLQAACNNLLDDFYFAVLHPTVSESLARKPDSLLLEKAIAKYNLDTGQCWMVGDTPRDIESAAKVGVKGIKIGEPIPGAVFTCASLVEAARFILQQTS
jgi:D-glycero-D-manno-heptose 1,7-bisphosphate phosphatase